MWVLSVRGVQPSLGGHRQAGESCRQRSHVPALLAWTCSISYTPLCGARGSGLRQVMQTRHAACICMFHVRRTHHPMWFDGPEGLHAWRERPESHGNVAAFLLE